MGKTARRQVSIPTITLDGQYIREGNAPADEVSMEILVQIRIYSISPDRDSTGSAVPVRGEWAIYSPPLPQGDSDTMESERREPTAGSASGIERLARVLRD